jgi:hypothetical protein
MDFLTGPEYYRSLNERARKEFGCTGFYTSVEDFLSGTVNISKPQRRGQQAPKVSIGTEDRPQAEQTLDSSGDGAQKLIEQNGSASPLLSGAGSLPIEEPDNSQNWIGILQGRCEHLSCGTS